METMIHPGRLVSRFRNRSRPAVHNHTAMKSSIWMVSKRNRVGKISDPCGWQHSRRRGTLASMQFFRPCSLRMPQASNRAAIATILRLAVLELRL